MFAKVLNINPTYMRARMWRATALAHMAALDEAAWEVAELMVADPGLSLERLVFAFPFKDPRVLDAVLDGLSKAGLPES